VCVLRSGSNGLGSSELDMSSGAGPCQLDVAVTLPLIIIIVAPKSLEPVAVPAKRPTTNQSRLNRLLTSNRWPLFSHRTLYLVLSTSFSIRTLRFTRSSAPRLCLSISLYPSGSESDP